MLSGRTLWRAAWVVSLVLAAGCWTGGRETRTAPHVPVHGTTNLKALAMQFAPRLRLHDTEPYGVTGVVAVFHPERPVIGYHVLFARDVFRQHDGERYDHEIVWVTYDPIALKVVDVATYWHRTVLRTDECRADANRSGRPTIDVQWGQHGLLPLGWEALRTARPALELHLHYHMVRHDGESSVAEHDDPNEFHGSYDEYVRFTEAVDLAPFVGDNVAVRIDPKAALADHLDRTFAEKKQWPDE